MQTLSIDEQVTVAASHLPQEQRQLLARHLAELLASSYALYLTTQRFHWNVKDKAFKQLHELFEEQYRNLAEGIDDIAEHIVMLGYQAPGSFTDFQKLSFIHQNITQPETESMLIKLDADHCAVIERLKIINRLIDELGAGFLSDLISERQAFHVKASWMLQSTLGYEALPLEA